MNDGRPDYALGLKKMNEDGDPLHALLHEPEPCDMDETVDSQVQRWADELEGWFERHESVPAIHSVFALLEGFAVCPDFSHPTPDECGTCFEERRPSYSVCGSEARTQSVTEEMRRRGYRITERGGMPFIMRPYSGNNRV